MWKLKKDAEEWFKNLNTGTELKFEKYYFCLMAGIKARRLGSDPDGVGFLDYFPENFKDSRYEMIGLLLEAELERLKVDYSSEIDVQKQLARLIDVDSQSKLSRDGFDAANKYASHGFHLLREELKVPPSDHVAFMVRFQKFMAKDETD